MEQNAHAYLWVAIFLHITTFTCKVKVITTTHNAKENFENQENVSNMQLSNMSMQMG
jgi:cell division protein FtsL